MFGALSEPPRALQSGSHGGAEVRGGRPRHGPGHRPGEDGVRAADHHRRQRARRERSWPAVLFFLRASFLGQVFVLLNYVGE